MQRVTSAGFFRIDQWMMQHLCQVLRKAQVIVVTDQLSQEDRARLFLPTESSVGAALDVALARHGRNAHVAVVPQGPYVLTTVRGRRLALGTAWQDAA